ncbi:Sugar fermentation stimulation protein A [Pseudoalteromonas holothuriae]|uniref:Sugar fermentation stimulation protein homolog n=1 Tax=Pseudoalteromonas holothuriae TaxID=2963714 RepID=A0A9W4QWA9_9GAMM|nr:MULTISPECIES: DNA/RNA nuclease SfsA [unclassified Pseudoalteromonas]CAH9053407.1 Sugar fermentation stimulation protein A [Pseudoalteromonas sp. CIP111951]CAH9056120.1 Sugar fermentation stimulation protein A [Pseudoalteromonas sp. CIP111854]
MKFVNSLDKATLLKRYKRFLVDLHCPQRGEFTVHCANTGKMTGCADAGFDAYYSTSDNNKRKYPHSLELTKNSQGAFICVNTNHANHVASEAIEQGVICELTDYQYHQREIKYGQENSRIDILLTSKNRPACYIEVKSVTLLEDKQGYFPDAQTLRGQKHIRELITLKSQGARAVLLFIVMHEGIESVTPAKHIDPKYASLLTQAYEAGVEVLAYKAAISEHEITLSHPVPVNVG